MQEKVRLGLMPPPEPKGTCIQLTIVKTELHARFNRLFILANTDFCFYSLSTYLQPDESPGDRGGSGSYEGRSSRQSTDGQETEVSNTIISTLFVLHLLAFFLTPLCILKFDLTYGQKSLL